MHEAFILGENSVETLDLMKKGLRHLLARWRI